LEVALRIEQRTVERALIPGRIMLAQMDVEAAGGAARH
jgi:hypothetical protein